MRPDFTVVSLVVACRHLLQKDSSYQHFEMSSRKAVELIDAFLAT